MENEVCNRRELVRKRFLSLPLKKRMMKVLIRDWLCIEVKIGPRLGAPYDGRLVCPRFTPHWRRLDVYLTDRGLLPFAVRTSLLLLRCHSLASERVYTIAVPLNLSIFIERFDLIIHGEVRFFRKMQIRSALCSIKKRHCEHKIYTLCGI